MNIKGLTDVGKRRNNNQDAFGFHSFSESECLLVVCDGMGGAAGGSIASTMVRDIFIERIVDSYNSDMNFKSLKNLFDSAINAANISVFDKAMNDETLLGMGTTLVAVLIKDDTAFLANVGDSRAYIIKNDDDSHIEQITIDHSIVQMMVECGQITAEEAQVHPKRNIITRAIGVADSVKADFYTLDFDVKDKFLLCSDGLTNYVKIDKICDIISKNTAEVAVSMLIDEANKNGGGDNITAVIAEIE